PRIAHGRQLTALARTVRAADLRHPDHDGAVRQAAVRARPYIRARDGAGFRGAVPCAVAQVDARRAHYGTPAVGARDDDDRVGLGRARGLRDLVLRLRRLEPARQLGAVARDRPEQLLGDRESVDERDRLFAQLAAQTIDGAGDRLRLPRGHAAVLEVPAALGLDGGERVEVA